MLLFKLFGELLEERPSPLSCDIPDAGEDDDANEAVYDDRLRIDCG